MKQRRQSYRRVNCVVPGCKRGTTRCPPNDDGTEPEIICASHWRTVPKSWRRTQAYLRRRAVDGYRRGDHQLEERAARAWWRGWERIVAMLSDPASVMEGEIPATLATQLKVDGLI